MDNPKERDDYFAHKYLAEVAGNRARHEAKGYTDEQIALNKSYFESELRAVRQSEAVLVKTIDAHFEVVNNFNARFADLGNNMATKIELQSAVNRVDEKIESIQHQTIENRKNIAHISTEKNTILSGGYWLIWLAIMLLGLFFSYNIYIK